MVGVAQLVERRIVIPVVVGSIPIVHPIFFEGALIAKSGAFVLSAPRGRGGVSRKAADCGFFCGFFGVKCSIWALQSSGDTPIKADRFQPVETPVRRPVEELPHDC